jgi:hypothetical protein
VAFHPLASTDENWALPAPAQDAGIDTFPVATGFVVDVVKVVALLVVVELTLVVVATTGASTLLATQLSKFAFRAAFKSWFQVPNLACTPKFEALFAGCETGDVPYAKANVVAPVAFSVAISPSLPCHCVQPLQRAIIVQ